MNKYYTGEDKANTIERIAETIAGENVIGTIVVYITDDNAPQMHVSGACRLIDGLGVLEWAKLALKTLFDQSQAQESQSMKDFFKTAKRNPKGN